MVKPEAVNALTTLHTEVVCVKNAVPVDVIDTVTALDAHEFAAGIEVAVVKVRTGLVPDVPVTRLAKGIDSPTRETCPIEVVGIATLTAQATVSLLVEILMPVTEVVAATPPPIVKPQMVTE